MARKYSSHRLEDIYETIEKEPGNKPGLIARLLSVPRSAVTRALPALEDEGYLLSEDEKGGLWPFNRK